MLVAFRLSRRLYSIYSSMGSLCICYISPNVGLKRPVQLMKRTRWGVALSEVRMYESEVALRPRAFERKCRSRRYWGQSNR